MELSRAGGTWYLVFWLAVAGYAIPPKKPGTEELLEMEEEKAFGRKSTGIDYSFEDRSAATAKDVEIELDEYGRELIPMKLAIKANPARLALPLEPDAEMLPAHYAGVKPPGVDHMELRRLEAEPGTGESKFKPVVVLLLDPVAKQPSHASDRYVSSKEASSGARVVDVGQTVYGHEKTAKGDEKRENARARYSDAGGKTREYFDEASQSGHGEKSADGQGGNSYRLGSSEGTAERSKGYRKVYHKDERKKDADFYDNEDHGGHFKKHDRYKQSYTATEDSYENGAAHNSDLGFTKSGKAGRFGNGHAIQDSKGYNAERANTEFLKTLREYGNTGGSSNGNKFGFLLSKSH